MLKSKKIKLIDVDDWDKFITKTYKKIIALFFRNKERIPLFFIKK
jgi:hypothetical protein